MNHLIESIVTQVVPKCSVEIIGEEESGMYRNTVDLLSNWNFWKNIPSSREIVAHLMKGHRGHFTPQLAAKLSNLLIKDPVYTQLVSWSRLTNMLTLGSIPGEVTVSMENHTYRWKAEAREWIWTQNER